MANRKLFFFVSLFLLVMLSGQSIAAVTIVQDAMEAIAIRLKQAQTEVDVGEAIWPEERDSTASIVAGMASAYELSYDIAYKTSAEMGGNYILSGAQGSFRGDEAFALVRLMQIPRDFSYLRFYHRWETALVDFYRAVKLDVGGTSGHISQFVGIEPSTAVFYLANHVVAAYHVDAEDKQTWRQALIDYLAQVDDDSSNFPVRALGVATWALAATGPLDGALIDPSGTGTAYWSSKTLADLPVVLLSHQVPDDELYAGSFYCRFDHGDGGSAGPVSGYTEDAIFAALGLISASRASPALDIEAAILAARKVLLGCVNSEGKVFEHLWLEDSDNYALGGKMLQVLGWLAVPSDLGDAMVMIADRLEAKQKLYASEGAWSEQTDFTGSIVAGMVSAYELTGNSKYKKSAELGGGFITSIAYESMPYSGDEAFALTRLSDISSDPRDNRWRTLVSIFHDRIVEVVGIHSYIDYFTEIEPSTAVFYLANHVVAAYYVDAGHKQIWRKALIARLSRVDDDSSYFPVMALGVATWALAATGSLDDTLIDPSGTGAAYWSGKTLADLPELLLSYQVSKGELFAGSFYWRFDHGDGGSGGPTSGYTEDAIFATLGLISASRANPALDLDAAINAAGQALVNGVRSGGNVFEHVWLQGSDYYVYGGEMLQVLGELAASTGLDDASVATVSSPIVIGENY